MLGSNTAGLTADIFECRNWWPNWSASKWGSFLRVPAPQRHLRLRRQPRRVDLFNGARIRLYGGDNPDRLRGIYLDGVVFDEYADMSPSVWLDVCRPSL